MMSAMMLIMMRTRTLQDRKGLKPGRIAKTMWLQLPFFGIPYGFWNG